MPLMDLIEFNVHQLNAWIPLFAFELRKKDAGLYRAKSIFEFVMTIQVSNEIV